MSRQSFEDEFKSIRKDAWVQANPVSYQPNSPEFEQTPEMGKSRIDRNTAIKLSNLNLNSKDSFGAEMGPNLKMVATRSDGSTEEEEERITASAVKKYKQTIEQLTDEIEQVK